MLRTHGQSCVFSTKSSTTRSYWIVAPTNNNAPAIYAIIIHGICRFVGGEVRSIYLTVDISINKIVRNGNVTTIHITRSRRLSQSDQYCNTLLAYPTRNVPPLHYNRAIRSSLSRVGGFASELMPVLTVRQSAFFWTIRIRAETIAGHSAFLSA